MLNILEFIFLNLAFTVVVTGVIINNFENYMPAFIIKGYRYGSFAYQGSNASFLNILEIPKSYYRHFYLFSSITSAICWISMLAAYFLQWNMSYLRTTIEVFVKYDNPSVSANAAFLAMTLLTIQCTKRFYETYKLQVFASKSKMNISHYAAGMIHYFGCIVAVLAQAPIFCGHKEEYVKLNNYTVIDFSITLLFLTASYEQYKTNVIFANLRKDKNSGKLVTEDHKVPFGRLFALTSSPHRMCEVLMYTILLHLIPTRLFFFIYLWVIGNQVQTAIQAHEWYKKTFNNYPRNRKAILPYVL